MINICDICRKNPCDSRCPNAPEPPEVYECVECGASILAGEYYYRLGKHAYCESCVKASLEEAELEHDFD